MCLRISSKKPADHIQWAADRRYMITGLQWSGMEPTMLNSFRPLMPAPLLTSQTALGSAGAPALSAQFTASLLAAEMAACFASWFLSIPPCFGAVCSDGRCAHRSTLKGRALLQMKPVPVSGCRGDRRNDLEVWKRLCVLVLDRGSSDRSGLFVASTAAWAKRRICSP